MHKIQSIIEMVDTLVEHITSRKITISLIINN